TGVGGPNELGVAEIATVLRIHLRAIGHAAGSLRVVDAGLAVFHLVERDRLRRAHEEERHDHNGQPGDAEGGGETEGELAEGHGTGNWEIRKETIWISSVGMGVHGAR